jgi:hypothetical protein
MLGFLIKDVFWDFITAHISQVPFLCFRTSRFIQNNKLKALLLVSPYLFKRWLQSSKEVDGLVGGSFIFMINTLTIVHS